MIQNSNGFAPGPPPRAASVRVIAIDGPSASGKSTLARMLAAELGWAYVDTGAMYRTFAWWCVALGLDVSDERRVAAEISRWPTRLLCTDGQVQLLVNGYLPQNEMRTQATTEAASKIAVHSRVRRWMVARQRDCVRFGALVVEGRNIGTRVFPEAEWKFFIEASIEARRDRRGGPSAGADLAGRDRRDSQRRGDPLMPALGAIRIDNSAETPGQTLERLLKFVRSSPEAPR